MGSYRDNAAEKIGERNWDAIRKEWCNYVPTHRSPWPIPESEIVKLESVQRLLLDMDRLDRKDRTIEEEIAGLRSAALHEAVILIHKAYNVLQAGASNGIDGYRTWSRSSAYHSAFFAMRALLAILGVLIVRDSAKKMDIQIDLWAPRAPKRRKLITESSFAVRLLARDRQAEHKELWGVLGRVLRVARVDTKVWPFLKVDPLRKLDPGDFSRIRHEIHYRSAGWLFDDLADRSKQDDLSSLAENVRSLCVVSNPEAEDFPFALALHVGSLGVALLQDLARDIPAIALELNRNRTWMDNTPWKTSNAFEARRQGGAA